MEKLAEIQSRIDKDPENYELWLEKGLHLIYVLDKPKEARDALNQGLYLNPFSADCHHRRGRKYITEGRYKEALADIIMAARIDHDNNEHWYYQGVAAYLSKYYMIAETAFKRATDLMIEQGIDEYVAPIEWLWLTLQKLGKKEEASELVAPITWDTPCIPRSLSYKRRILLYNGTIKPEDFLDREDIKTRDRPDLYLISELYGLGNYYYIIGEVEKSNELLLEARDVPTFHGAFAYQQACNDLAERGL